MNYQLCKDVMRNDARRKAFNELADKTFQLSFENWYQDGYWEETNMPYTLFDGKKAVANVSANRMELIWQGKKCNYIQLGTVMTDVSYRNQGLSRLLMDEIMKDWETQCDAIFLFANKRVLDFYPKFGFKREKQYRYSTRVDKAPGLRRKMDMSCLQDREMLKKYYLKSNPFSNLQVVNNYSVLMFYCSSFMKDSVYYIPQCDAVVIGEQEGSVFHCFEIFCDGGKNLNDMIRLAAPEGINEVILGFTPKDGLSYKIKPVDDSDNALFVLKSKENIFEGQELIFPEIFHT
ncbi:MAG: GNAT family N-acetyltransferase [Lacrimispora sp.]|uniref:GNAT family N-acetyltransferase n=1 Tax=Lacrimispora sp. TaxID=2719234 RepID=UPI0039E51784